MFSDFLENIKKGAKKFFTNRVAVIGVFFAILAVLLVARLIDLQVIKGEEYYENYVNTTKREVSIPALRGNIYDKNGVLLAGNKVVYNVTLRDENYYTKGDGSYNEMLLRLIRILERFDCRIVTAVPVIVDEQNLYQFSGSNETIRRFIRDVYGGTTGVEERQAKGDDPYTYSAETVMTYLSRSLYNFNDRWPTAATLSKEDVLQICHIRYAMSATSYTRYISTSISTDVSTEVQAAILESQDQLLGVSVEESYQRVYHESLCFSSIIGFVGGVTLEEIEEYNAAGGDYVSGDTVGKEGIESAYESFLQGTKGSKTIYVNSTGMILAEENVVDPIPGQDVYLSIDANLTVATYNIIQQQLAGVIIEHLYSGNDYDPVIASQTDDYKTPIRDVYFQMINNNVLDMNHFDDEDATVTEAAIYQVFQDRKTQVLAFLTNYMTQRDTTPLADMDEYLEQYIRYFYTYMNEEGYLNPANITSADTTYQAWRSGDISFSEMVIYALQSGWADMSVINNENRYNTVDESYEHLISLLLESVTGTNNDFDKLVYDELIHQDHITGNQIGIALMEQGILPYSQDEISVLAGNRLSDAYNFFENKIYNLEISPAQIALDPCSASTVIMSPSDGKVLALVSYPGYDSNQINNTTYYNKLINDASSPLYNRATQTRIAPGSTFKLITSTAALEENYVGLNEFITCNGVFDKLDHPQCWIYRTTGGRDTHGPMDVVHAIGQSCNIYFYEMGYRFSTNAEGRYSPQLGLEVLQKYSALYGFGTKTGLEITENNSVLTDELPVTSAIGQGTSAFTTVSLARYVVALASRGNVYELRLLDHIQSGEEVVESYTPQIVNHLELKDTTWNSLQVGMYTVVHEGGSRNGDFDGLVYDYAAKSGTAQENLLRASHGLYISYGPFENPEYAVATMIPNGYAAGNASLIVKDVYNYLEGGITLEEIKENTAYSGNANNVLD